MSSPRCPRCHQAVAPAAVVCAHCGAPVSSDDAIPWAVPVSGEDVVDAVPAEPASETWQPYRDEWAGVSLERPAGWEVGVTQGIVTVRQDAAGLTSALIWPLTLHVPLSAEAVARQVIGLAHSANPTFTAWRVPPAAVPAAPASPGAGDTIFVRTQARQAGRLLDGAYTVMVSGTSALITGFQGPGERVQPLLPTLGRILASFRPIPRLPRTSFRDPTEGSFTALVPQGWQARGGTNRGNNVYGIGFPSFEAASDAAGTLKAAVVWLQFAFSEGLGGLWGMATPGVQMLPSMPAAVFAERWLVPWLRQHHAGLKLERAIDRPDLLPAAAAEWARAGLPLETVELSVAALQVTYREGNTVFREKLGVSVQRAKPGMGFFTALPGMWAAQVPNFVRAPADQFERWEPVLLGVIDSLQIDQQWQQIQNQQVQARCRVMQQDTQRRLGEISHTLSETSDIITSGYWQRQAVHDRLSHTWSNTIMGTQDVVDPSGTVYNVPNGYDQYWRDNRGYVYGGGWLVNPDPTWHKLEPTGM
jgi:hypothetical protein